MTAHSLETQLALIQQRLDTIVLAVARLDVIETRVDVLERLRIADEARSEEVTVSVAPRSRKQLLVVGGASAGGGVTFGVLLERLLSMLV